MITVYNFGDPERDIDIFHQALVIGIFSGASLFLLARFTSTPGYLGKSSIRKNLKNFGISVLLFLIPLLLFAGPAYSILTRCYSVEILETEVIFKGRNKNIITSVKPADFLDIKFSPTGKSSETARLIFYTKREERIVTGEIDIQSAKNIRRELMKLPHPEKHLS